MGLRGSVGGNTGDLGEGARASRSGTLWRSPFLVGPVPLGPLLQTLEAGPQLPGLLRFVLKDTLQGQAPGPGPSCPLSWAGHPPVVLLPRRHCSLR